MSLNGLADPQAVRLCIISIAFTCFDELPVSEICQYSGWSCLPRRPWWRERSRTGWSWTLQAVGPLHGPVRCVASAWACCRRSTGNEVFVLVFDIPWWQKCYLHWFAKFPTKKIGVAICSETSRRSQIWQIQCKNEYEFLVTAWRYWPQLCSGRSRIKYSLRAKFFINIIQILHNIRTVPKWLLRRWNWMKLPNLTECTLYRTLKLTCMVSNLISSSRTSICKSNL